MKARFYDKEKLSEITEQLNSGSFLTMQDLTGKQFISFNRYLYGLEIKKVKDKIVIEDKLFFHKELALDSELSFGGNSLIVSNKTKDTAFMIISNTASMPNKYYESLMGNYINYYIHNKADEICNSELLDEYSVESGDMVEELLNRIKEANLIYLNEIVFRKNDVDLKIKIDVKLSEFMDYLEGVIDKVNMTFDLNMKSLNNQYNDFEEMIKNILEKLDENSPNKVKFGHPRYDI